MRPTKNAAFLLSLLLSLASSALAQEPEAEQQPTRFAAAVDTVSLSVTLSNESGGLVPGLPLENFKVFEDGVEQVVQFFSHGEVPLKLVILLDVSASMRMKLEMAQEAAVRFVDSLRVEDEVQVVEFGNRVLTLAPFTSDRAQLSDAIRSTKANGATALYRAIYVSLKDLTAAGRGELYRRAVVVLSDGNDTRSNLGFEDVKEQARKNNVIIYAISLRANEDDLKKDKYRNAKYELDQLAFETGGVSYAPEKIDDLAGVYDQILSELKSQYSLGYVSTNSKQDGKWRRIQVLTAEPGTHVRTREGYYAPRRSRLQRRRRSN